MYWGPAHETEDHGVFFFSLKFAATAAGGRLASHKAFGGPGIGHGVAQAFHGEGFRLALISRQPDKYRDTYEPLGAQAFAADAGEETARKCPPSIVEGLGRVDHHPQGQEAQRDGSNPGGGREGPDGAENLPRHAPDLNPGPKIFAAGNSTLAAGVYGLAYGGATALETPIVQEVQDTVVLPNGGLIGNFTRPAFE